jgi:hypothetical protein
MARQLLSSTEIDQLVFLLKDVFTYISNLKEKNPLAADIQYPKLPPKLTESLAIHLLRRGLIPALKEYDFRFGGNEADIIASRGSEKARIEVKGTTKGFEYFGEKDIKANYLVWFDFEELFRKGGDHFTLFVLPYRESRFRAPLKITMSSLKKVAGVDLEPMRYNIQDLLHKITSQATD